MKLPDSVIATVEVALDPLTAFAVFTEEIGQWWRPGPINWNDSRRAISIRIEPGIGGRWIEVYDATTGEGFDCGHITVWEPGVRFVFFYRDAGHAIDDTEVEIRFEAIDGGTRVTLEHRGWDKLLPDVATEKREIKRWGWANILGWFSEWAFWGTPRRVPSGSEAHFPTLTTNRLLLRQIQSSDAEALFAILSDKEVIEFYGHEPHQSLDDTRKLIGQIQARYARREAIRWGITLQGEDRLIGTCSLQHFDPGFHHAETGYELDRAFWGKGIMTEATSAILTYGFTELGLHRVEAIIDIMNERSKALLLKLGFTYEGNLRQRYSFRDRFEDEHYFGLLAHEWHGSV